MDIIRVALFSQCSSSVQASQIKEKLRDFPELRGRVLACRREIKTENGHVNIGDYNLCRVSFSTDPCLNNLFNDRNIKIKLLLGCPAQERPHEGVRFGPGRTWRK